MNDERFMRLLAYAIYDPTPARVRERVRQYTERGCHARAYMDNAEPWGIVVFRLDGARAEIVNISTNPGHRRQGISRRLVYRIAAEYPVREIYAETDDDARGFYMRCGFKTRPERMIGEVQRYACVLTLPGKCYCGHDCARCNVYLATVRDDDALRDRAREFYRDALGRELPAEAIRCLGGRSECRFGLCDDCPFAACCRMRGYDSCAECAHECDMHKDYKSKYVNSANVCNDS